MDKFDEFQKQMATRTSMDAKIAINELKKKCECGECASYTACATTKRELLFCIEGKSKSSITQDKGCVCGSCHVNKEMGFTQHDFCFKGSEQEMRLK
jgi:hypothetical protein